MVNNKNASFKKIGLGLGWADLYLTTEKNMKIQGAAAVTVAATDLVISG